MLAVIRDQVETPKLKDFKTSGSWFPGVLARMLAVIGDQVETPKLKDFHASQLFSRCPGQDVSGNKGPNGSP